eukprot:CAMPEP_0171399882 /NCGR_PEP_ID=MMETSP0880-20121228/6910_1 /TAXON_ID=67004 /ORGANISM="Thalassiosira weissflogii, Strain CCMP1336" /LENGTH=189 /DNA_ID=CAMNT_0011914117 /DNA_START=218 /DNA_END=787 /DNA_ORIENTATION=-
MNGTWILDKSRGSPSMRGYLETMGVTELAIEAHEKGEAEHETIHQIDFADNRFRIKKVSRVTDLDLELTLGEEFRQNMPGDRVKTVLATSECPGQEVRIESRMPTMNGVANVVDVKSLVREGDLLILVQTLTITNELTGKQHTTTRYFVPHQGEIGAPAATAKDSEGKSRRSSGVGRMLGADMDDDEED